MTDDMLAVALVEDDAVPFLITADVESRVALGGGMPLRQLRGRAIALAPPAKRFFVG